MLIKKMGGGKKKWAKKWALKNRPFLKNGRTQKKKWALDGRQQKNIKIVLHLLKNCKKRSKKLQKKVKSPIKKKWAHQKKKKNGRKNGREEKRPFFFNGRSKKKKRWAKPIF